MRTLCTLLVITAATTGAARVQAQVVPEHLYYGVNRPIPVTVTSPSEDAKVELALYDATGRQIVDRSVVTPGPVDLFEVFPVLWNRSQPQPLYLQTLIDGQPYGSPIFLEPLRPPLTSTLDPRTQQVVWSDDRRRPYTGLRTYPARLAVFETSAGEFTVKMRPDVAPNTVFHIMNLIDGGFYTDIVFHRIIPKNAAGDPFVIQFGDPQGFGLGGPGFYVDLEPGTLAHGFGVMSMARRSDSPDSNGSQVFICLSRAATAHLDNNYTAFAEVVDGLDTVLALESSPLEDAAKGAPADPKPVVRAARTIPAPPIDQWPNRIRRTDAEAPTGQER